MKRDKILFLSSKDPFSKKDWSGIPYFMMVSLKEKYDVDYAAIPRFRIIQQLGYYFGRLFEFVTTRKYTFDYGVFMAWCYGRAGTKLVKDKAGYRFIFVPAGLMEIAFLKTNLPIVSVGDCSTLQLFGYYPALKEISAVSKREVKYVEAKALKKVTHAIFSSGWAGEFVLNQYQLSKVNVIPFGANLSAQGSAEGRTPDSGECRLLFVGVDWERKGGSTALAICEQLQQEGVQVSLSVLGAAPPSDAEIPEGITLQVKNVDKDSVGSEGEYISILQQSDFFILPTLADCTPIVIAEAYWAGVPVLATNTGGVSSMVNHGVSGFLFEPDDVNGYVKIIKELLSSPRQYQEISKNCVQISHTVFNWRHWVEELDRITASSAN
ncbi:MAG: glycosyltransferase family 4 protein [Cyclobacteriaceae bacterium]|nr:glycosyltransferase family 4 protein [Cyclobacteriaceae bacterium]